MRKGGGRYTTYSQYEEPRDKVILSVLTVNSLHTKEI